LTPISYLLTPVFPRPAPRFGHYKYKNGVKPLKIEGTDSQVFSGIQEEGEQVGRLKRPPVQALQKQQQQTSEQSGERLDSSERMLEELEDAVDKMNKTARTYDIALEFRVHEGTDRWMVEVWEKNVEDELVKEIPPQKFLDMVASIQQMIGVMVDAHR